MNREIYSDTLDAIPADSRLIEELYAHGKMSRKAREYALNMLYPHKQWGVWISRLLLTIGTALILSGIVFFFAFNWTKLTPFIKFTSIQLGIVICLIGAFCYSLERMNGQVLLLSGSVLVGVLIATVGHVYQTGADAYQIFMMWSLLTLGWTLVSHYALQWFFWLGVTNTFLVLWWLQAALPSKEMEFMIFIYMALFNGGVLALREYCAVKKNAYAWLNARWTRMLLSIVTLLILLIPAIALSVTISNTDSTVSIILSGIIGIVGHGAMYFFYRYKMPDMLSLAATVLSGCIIAEVAMFSIFFDTYYLPTYLMYLIIGLLTLGIFTYAIIHLKKIGTKMVADDV